MADDDGGGSPSVSDADLPPDVLSEEDPGSDACSPCPALGTKCACKNRCYEKVSLQTARNSREQLLILSHKDRAWQVLAAVSGQVYDRDGQVKPGRTKWTFQGVRVCRPFWEYATQQGMQGWTWRKSAWEWGLMGLLNDSPGFLLGCLSSSMQTHGSLTSTRAWGSLWQKWTTHFFDAEGCVPLDDADHPLWSLTYERYARK